MSNYKVGYFVGSLSTSAEFLRNYMTEFHAFIMRVYTVLPRNA